MSLWKTIDSVAGEGGANPVLKGRSQARFSILQVDNAVTWGPTSFGESSFFLVGPKAGPRYLDLLIPGRF